MTTFTPQLQTIGLFAGIGVVLVVASVIGYVLKVSVAHGRPHGVIDNLNTRIKAWWAMVLVIGFAFLFGRAGVTLLFLFVSFVALREFEAVACARGGEDVALTTGFIFVLPVQYLLAYLGWLELFAVFIPVYAFVVLPAAGILARDTGHILGRVAKVRWALMICVYCISHVPALLALDIPGYGGRDLLLVVFLVLVVQSSDVLQYVWGMLVGRHKVAPVVSPSKTWEGLVGGVASSTTLGAALFWITPFTPAQAALMALVINTMGFLGGLVLSAIKRDRGVKDWGRMIEGHGGVLDRLDSVVFAAPVFFYLTRFGWT
jgi:phosphatidate cytidylyltransferase